MCASAGGMLSSSSVMMYFHLDSSGFARMLLIMALYACPTSWPVAKSMARF